MPEEKLESLRRQLTKIIKEEIRTALRQGPTDRETIAKRVESRATMLIAQLEPELAAAEIREIIRRMLKTTEVKSEDTDAMIQQMEFADMDQFRGIPYNVTYEDRPGHVVYVCYLDTRQFERAAALKLLADSIEADQQTYLAMKAGNDFADTLVLIYGDLPPRDLYRHYKADQQKRRGGIA